MRPPCWLAPVYTTLKKKKKGKKEEKEREKRKFRMRESRQALEEA